MGEPAPGSYHDQGRYAPQFEEVGSDVDHEEYEASNLNVEAVSDPPGSEEEGQRQATLEELLIGRPGLPPGSEGINIYIPGIGNVPLSSLGQLTQQFGGGGGPPRQAPQPEVGERAWAGFRQLPEPTQSAILGLTVDAHARGDEEFTLLLLGKGGVGKSATVNSLLGERAAIVSGFQATTNRPAAYTRTLPDGFRFTVIDTPSLLEQDAVSTMRLEGVAEAIRDTPIDAVLYLDRLDVYATDGTDEQLVDAITAHFGADIWDQAVLGFTRATPEAPPLGTDFAAWAEQRPAQLAALVRKAQARYGGGRRGGKAAPAPALPVALLENHSACPQNGEGERLVPGGVAWVSALVRALRELRHARGGAWRHDAAAAARAANPDRRRKWLIPLVLAAQVALKLLLDRVLEWDQVAGDEDGPFDPQTVRERARELQARKALLRKQALAQKRRLARGKAEMAKLARGDVDSDDE